MYGKPEAVFYMGSHTTPPCEENTYHMVFTQPLIMSGCQFKLLRENSLTTHKPVNIHARAEQPIADRLIYKYNTAKMKYIKNIHSIIPLEFNKYLLKREVNERKAEIICTKKGCLQKKLSNKKKENIKVVNNKPDCNTPDNKNEEFDVNW
jgi:carbonic anhydrase